MVDMSAATVKRLCQVFLLIEAVSASIEGRTFGIDYDNNTFVKDGKPFRYISGSIHYSRVPYQYWDDRLHKMAAAGLNAIQTYVPWNIHEQEQGHYDFSGQQDIVAFLETAQKYNLSVIMRPGPYICGEWEFGGFPAWLLRQEGIKVRTMDPKYINPVGTWLTKLFTVLEPLLYKNGGPIITVQIENEYGSYPACDYKYLEFLRDKAKQQLGDNVVLFTTDGDECGTFPAVYATVDFGIENEYGSYPACDYKYLEFLRDKAKQQLGDDVVLFTTDGDGDGFLKCGTLPDVYATVDFGVTYTPEKNFAIQRHKEPKGPLVNSEFYTGWLDHWGEKHSTTPTAAVAKSLDLMLALGANVNMYMFEGGTNFGFWNGANYPYHPVPTSYDYDAPLSETGDITEKYQTLREVITKYNPVDMKIPPSTEKAAYEIVEMTLVDSLYNVIKTLGASVSSKYPLTFEDLQNYYGYVVYSHTIKSAEEAELDLSGVRDRAYVSLNRNNEDTFVGVIERDSKSVKLNIGVEVNDRLTIIVENQGRINYGGQMNNNNKGLIVNATLNGVNLTDWVQSYMDLKTISLSAFPPAHAGVDFPNTISAVYMGQLNIEGDPHDTYLDMSRWTKGQLFVNGNNMGRYWPNKGPQVRLYIPKYALKTGQNKIIMIELGQNPCSTSTKCFIEFMDQPLINGNVTANNDGGETQSTQWKSLSSIRWLLFIIRDVVYGGLSRVFF